VQSLIFQLSCQIPPRWGGGVHVIKRGQQFKKFINLLRELEYSTRCGKKFLVWCSHGTFKYIELLYSEVYIELLYSEVDFDRKLKASTFFNLTERIQ
jgi:hypothetical protein